MANLTILIFYAVRFLFLIFLRVLRDEFGVIEIAATPSIISAVARIIRKIPIILLRFICVPP